MKFLVDEALSAKVAAELRRVGYDAIHVGDLDLLGQPDRVILDAAAGSGRVLISADTDFGGLIAKQASTAPSLILLRPAPDSVERQAAVLLNAIPGLEEYLAVGCVAVIESARIRVRKLPIGNGEWSGPDDLQ